MKASKKLVLVLVDCTQRGSNRDLIESYEVSGFPTVVFADPDGTKVDEFVGAEEADLVREKFERVAAEYSR